MTTNKIQNFPIITYIGQHNIQNFPIDGLNLHQRLSWYQKPQGFFVQSGINISMMFILDYRKRRLKIHNSTYCLLFHLNGYQSCLRLTGGSSIRLFYLLVTTFLYMLEIKLFENCWIGNMMSMTCCGIFGIDLQLDQKRIRE